MLSHIEALHSARQLRRTLTSAPVPQARTREIFGLLARAEGWSAAQGRAVVAFGAWLEGRPLGSLKPKCDELLNGLAARAR
jgi:hypothetical protein